MAPQLVFQLVEDRRQRSLLLASVSSSHAERGSSPWALPASAVPHQLKRVIKLLPRPAQHGAKQPAGGSGAAGPDLGRAGAELQRAAALAAGVLIAGIAQAARQVAAARQGGGGSGAKRHQGFHESFRLPWHFDRGAGKRGSSRESQALARTLVARGQELSRNLDVRAAVQCFEEVNRLAPGRADYLSMLAKQWSDLTFFHDVTTDRERQLVNLKALEYADKAVVEHPDNVLGHVAQCVSKGRLALFTDNRTKVRLAKEAQEAARVAITVDPQSDIAHHLMGRWHYEMAQINPLLRTLVRLMYGTALSPGTHADALASYVRAVELAPQRLIHRVEQGKVLMALGRREAAAVAFKESLDLEIEDLNAFLTRMDAERLLAQLEKRPYKQPSLVPPQMLQQPTGKAIPTPASLCTAALLEKSETGVPQRRP